MAVPQEVRTVPWQSEPLVRATQKRTVLLLAAAQIVGGVGVGVASSLGPLLAESVAHNETYAGLARTATTLGAAAVGVPLAFFAQRRGRRTALSAGWLAAAVGGGILVGAAVLGAITLLVVGMLLFGIGSATNQQSRYAAADLALPHRQARALSIVVWSTTIGAVIGPNLGTPGAGVAAALHLPRLSGAFLLSGICMVAAAVLLWGLLRPDPLLLARRRTDDEKSTTPTARARGTDHDTALAPTSLTGTVRAVWRHLRHAPRAAFAFMTIVVAHTVMVANMTMSPVSLTRHGTELTIVGVAISGHLLGMYAFSPAVGWLADRLGNLPIAVAGQIIFLLSATFSGLSRGSVALTAVGLVLLGLGWSCSLVAGSAMLNETTPRDLQTGVQGTSDTAMNIVAAIGAGAAGPLMQIIGYAGLNIAAAVLVLPVIAFSALLPRAQRARQGDLRG